MVQKEIKHKTRLYTIVAVLLAAILVSSIYAVTTPTVMYSLTGVSPMKTFTSTNELKNYLLVNAQQDFTANRLSEVSSGSSSEASSIQYWTRPSDVVALGYSTTNIQVTGVDEADIVKTDGEYIYIMRKHYGNSDYDLNGNQISSSIQIVKADSKKPSIVGKIDFTSVEPDSASEVLTTCVTDFFGMYLSENGDKLAVLGRNYYRSILNNDVIMQSAERSYVSFIYVYDVSNKVEPKLTRNVTLSSDSTDPNSRMIGNYLYAVISQPVIVDDSSVVLPQISTGEINREVFPSNIYYTKMQDNYSSYNTFVGINIMDDTEQPTTMTILMGTSSCMYVSTNNMYVTFSTAGDTEIYRVAINGANLSFKAQGIVPGYVLNQYSMDEYNDYFRIATTVSPEFWFNRGSDHNNLYVLNLKLAVVGKVENLAQGERIYSARFMGDKAYLVTFRQVDPFFVLDLKDPTSPKVTGELKIPGYSSYLHPYNENYVIGIGREGPHVKLSFFDVTDMHNPTEIAKYLIGENDTVSDSMIRRTPKAFLFDLQKQLLVIPTTIMQRNTPNWEGVYVFQVSPENGFTLQKDILQRHYNNDQDWRHRVLRSLYIDDTLYTISNDSLKLSSLNDFNSITQIYF
ncbi:MAG: beta-propeller domain-containing protein [Candidatus Bathyarchaeota archaeon]|nr:beta-propeller domain-containing protein [Candidatus Termiticorpusculum sp.]